MATQFVNLYDYVARTGVVIPDTAVLQTMVENRFKEIFGSEVSLDPTTPMGIFVSSITQLCKDVIGVNSQNANWSGTAQTVGAYLDAIGSLFGVNRDAGESDDEYRARLSKSMSLGAGFAESIRREVGNVNGVTCAVVLDNGYATPTACPSGSKYAITIPAHSIFVCVNGGNSDDIAHAILNTKSSGCGFTTTSEYGEVEKKIVDENDIYFYRPTKVNVTIDVTVDGSYYTGGDIESDVQSEIAYYLAHHTMGSVLTPTAIISHITNGGLGITATDIVIRYNGQAQSELVVKPYQVVVATTITVNH